MHPFADVGPEHLVGAACSIWLVILLVDRPAQHEATDDHDHRPHRQETEEEDHEAIVGLAIPPVCFVVDGLRLRLHSTQQPSEHRHCELHHWVRRRRGPGASADHRPWYRGHRPGLLEPEFCECCETAAREQNIRTSLNAGFEIGFPPNAIFVSFLLSVHRRHGKLGGPAMV